MAFSAITFSFLNSRRQSNVMLANQVLMTLHSETSHDQLEFNDGPESFV